MAIKVLIKRKFKPENLDEVRALLKKFRSDAITHEGYISGETLSAVGTPEIKTIISCWQTLVDWERWRESRQRQENEAMLEIYQQSPTEYEIYQSGSMAP